MEVSARVAGAGVGIALRTDTPSPAQVRDAVATSAVKRPASTESGETARR